uniref:HCO3_cotransp domain-containing protein n=1 Tax=Elaeophora elaphi TaxID=1147741 RepID=A0A0R3RPH7_9BILA
MPSPSSPLEYRPTPHLILIIVFVFLPLIYLCGRLAVTSCFILLCVLKSMFSPVLQLLYGNEFIPIPQIRCVRPARIMTSTMQEAQVGQSSDEQLTDETDEEHELMDTIKITDDFIKAQPKNSVDVQAIQSHLKIQTGLSLRKDLHDSEHDSGNDEDHSALSVSSTATTSTNQTLDIPETETMQDHTFKETVQWRHRDKAFKMSDM